MKWVFGLLAFIFLTGCQIHGKTSHDCYLISTSVSAEVEQSCNRAVCAEYGMIPASGQSWEQVQVSCQLPNATLGEIDIQLHGFL